MFNTQTFTTIIILIMLLGAVSSLGFALFYLLYDQGNNKRTVKALTMRIGISLVLFMGILVGVQCGWIVPNPHPF